MTRLNELKKSASLKIHYFLKAEKLTDLITQSAGDEFEGDSGIELLNTRLGHFGHTGKIRSICH